MNKFKLFFVVTIALVFSSCSLLSKSPQGTLIFSIFTGDKTELYSAKLPNGKAEKILTLDGSAFFAPPQDDSILYLSNIQGGDIWTVGLVKGEEHLYRKDIRYPTTFPFWANDGSFAYAYGYWAWGDGTTTIVQVYQNGEERIFARLPAGMDTYHNYLPVGDRIVVLAVDSAKAQLVITTDQGYLKVSIEQGLLAIPRPGPGNQEVSVVGHEDTDCIITVNLQRLEKKINYCSASSINIRNFSWSPDGKYILVIDDDTYYQSLSLVTADGARVWRTTFEDFIQAFSWSPDGKWIAYSFYDGQEIFLIPVEMRDNQIAISIPDGGVHQIFWLK